jgi:hypothetical protein
MPSQNEHMMNPVRDKRTNRKSEVLVRDLSGKATRQVRNVLEQDLRIASKAAGKSKLLRRR